MRNTVFAGLCITVCCAIGGVALYLVLARENGGLMVETCDPTSGRRWPIRWARATLPVPTFIGEKDAAVYGRVQEALRVWDPDGHAFSPLAVLPMGVPPPPGLRIFVTLAPGDADHGYTRLTWNDMCYLRRADVVLPSNTESTVWDCVVRHEIGHTLGFDHDAWEDLVMFPRRSKWFGCNLEEADVDLFARTYAPREEKR